MRILLFSRFRRLAIKLLEGKAEARRVIVLSLRHFEAGNQFLHLMQHVIVVHVSFVLLHIWRLSIIYAKQVVAEVWNHVELLHHAVHVADATEIFQPDVLLVRNFYI